MKKAITYIFSFSIFLHVILLSAPANAQTCNALFTYQQAGNTLTVAFADLSTGSNLIISWLWTFGDGDSSLLQNPSHTYSHDGTDSVCLTIHTTHGCTSTFCQVITVNPSHAGCHALFGFQQTANTFTVNFSDSSSSQDSIFSWLWVFGDGDSSTLQNPTHTYAHAGTNNVCLTIHDTAGCSSTFCHHFTLNPTGSPCHAAYTFVADTSGNIIHFTNTSTGTTIHTTYSWNFGDGQASSAENPDHSYIHTGHYMVCLFISDSTTGCSSHSCHDVNLPHPLVHHHPAHQWFHHSQPALAEEPSLRNQQGTDELSEHQQYILSYPNPFSITTTIQYELTREADVQIELFDLPGNRLNLLTHEKESEGLHTLNLSAVNLNPGFYFIKISADEQLFIKKITVVK